MVTAHVIVIVTQLLACAKDLIRHNHHHLQVGLKSHPACLSFQCQAPYLTMSAPINEKVSSKERQAIWVELQSLRRDTQAFRAEVYRLRTVGGLNKATNERLRSQQNELERRGEVLIKQ